MDLSHLPIEERFVRASGPGGQNVNKVATAVQLRLDVAASPFPADVKQRLQTLAGHRMTTEGMLVIDAREYRTQSQNRDAARARLSALIEQAHHRPRKRRPTRPSKSSKEKRLTSKRKDSEKKRTRGRARGED